MAKILDIGDMHIPTTIGPAINEVLYKRRLIIEKADKNREVEESRGALDVTLNESVMASTIYSDIVIIDYLSFDSLSL